MAETLPTFSASADIVPLQQRFFSYARTLPTAAQPAAYALAKQTFGNIQNLRDIQQARELEAADRASALELKRAQLEEGRYQLALAREKYRRGIVGAERSTAVSKQLGDLYGRTDIDQAEKMRLADQIAIENADVMESGSAASNAYQTMRGAFATPRVTQYGLEALASREGATAKDFERYGVDELTASALIEQAKREREDLRLRTEAAAAEKKRVEDERTAKARATETVAKNRLLTRQAGGLAKVIERKAEDNEPLQDADYKTIDNTLTALDAAGLLTNEDKKELADVGINTFLPPGKGKRRPAMPTVEDASGVRRATADRTSEYATWPDRQKRTVAGILANAIYQTVEPPVPEQDLSFDAVN